MVCTRRSVLFLERCMGALFFIIQFEPLAYAQVDMLTRHNNPARTGANLQEHILNVSNVKNGSFGKLARRVVDGNLYAQPLIVSGAKAAGRATTDLVILATEHNSVYAFDANDIGPSSLTAQVWHTGPDKLGNSIESTKLYTDIGIPTCTDITTEVGITSTPAIRLTRQQSPKRGVVFTVAKSWSDGKYSYSLFALDLSSGAVLSKTNIEGEVLGSGKGSITLNGQQVIRFNAEYQLNRPALLISGTTLYLRIRWALRSRTLPRLDLRL